MGHELYGAFTCTGAGNVDFAVQVSSAVEAGGQGFLLLGFQVESDDLPLAAFGLVGCQARNWTPRKDQSFLQLGEPFRVAVVRRT